MPETRTTDPGEAAALQAAGARLVRQRHHMVLDLDGPAQAVPKLPAGLRLIAIDEAAPRLPAASILAYGHGHPDAPASLAEAETRWQELLADQAVAPVLEPPSVAIIDATSDEVVGAVVVMRLWPEPWDWPGGPWVGDIFVVPAHQGRGLGWSLLMRAVAWAHDAGEPRIGLSVTVGNPAERLYVSAGFRRRRTTFILETA